MRKLTNKEKQIMDIYWNHGPLFVRELLEFYPEPRPHFNTISTQVRTLEKDGFLDHHTVGGSFQYYPIIEEKEYGKRSIASVVSHYFDNSYISAVSSFVKEEKITVGELKDLIQQIENHQEK
ncbi:MAG: BlaI/MecI/CopY family transcriptional regulator [Prevotella sp.]|nr:BlaI/MecI/CopY family transcriptional regulator [Prevotella sp.]